jgi:hypothetical protein
MNTLKESAKIVGKDFEGWSPLLVEESRNAGANARVGTELLLESSVARIWSIDLRPGQRLPFHDIREVGRAHAQALFSCL